MKQHATQPRHGRRWLIMIVTFLVALGIGSFGYASYYHQRFKPTQINGVTVTNLTVAQATQKLNQAASQNPSASITMSASKVAVTQAKVKQLLTKRNTDSHPVETVKMTLTQTISAAQQKYRLTTLLTQFKQKIATINANRTKPVDAKVILKNGQISVQAGKAGNTLDEAKMVATYKQQAQTASVISVKKVTQQAVSANSNTLSQAKAKLQKLLSQTVTVAFPSKTITFKASDYLKNGTVTAAKFKTHSGTTITVPSGGTYGWSISQSKLTNRILSGFENSASQSINLKDYVTGTGYGKANTVGNTYIEVDLKTLREYAYVNGKLKFSTKVMSGTITGGNQTPQGIYYIMYKQRNTTLTGDNDNGSTYHSKVKYWMPITNSGVGLHDSSWQPSYVYGNTSYRSDYHSHGCINNPPSKMGALYALAYAGEPVIVYN